MAQPFDERLSRLLETLSIPSNALLGEGGESRVYALDQARVARVSRPGSSRTQIESRAALLAELGHSSDQVPFSIPQVLDILEIENCTLTIERRLLGRPLLQLLAHAKGQERPSLIRGYLDAAAKIGNLAIERPWYGDLLSPNPIRSRSFQDYLRKRAAQSLQTAGPPFQHLDPAPLAADLPRADEKALVHLDAFPGNMLSDGQSITAVLDFGASCIVGDRRLDPLAAAVYLDPAITPTANEGDRVTARNWLVDHELDHYFKPAQKWLAAYWSFATDDRSLYRWCHRILNGRGQQLSDASV